MADSKLSPGAFVRHDTFGVGRLNSLGDDGSVVVDFTAEKGRHMSARVAANLKVLSDNGLEVLTWIRPDEVRGWIMDAPLKLLASTLTDVGRTAKSRAIIEKLEGLVLDSGVKWSPWWDRVRLAVADSKHFRTVRNKGNAIIGISLRPGVGVDDVPAEPLPEKPKATRKPKTKPPTTKEWKTWLLGETYEPPPGPSPTSRLFNDLDKWPVENVERALKQTLQATRDFLDLGSRSSRIGAGWLHAMTLLSLRWRECMEPDSCGDLAFQAGEILPQLLKTSESRDGATELSLLNGALAGQPDKWRTGFMGGIWFAAQDDVGVVLNLLRAAHTQQTALTGEICLAAFNAVHSNGRNAQLDRLVRALPVAERIRLLRNLLLRSSNQDAPIEEVANYVAESPYATRSGDPDTRLNLLVLSALLIGDERNEVVKEASSELADAFESSDASNGAVQELFRQVRNRNEALRASIADEFESRRREYESEYEAQLGSERRKKERMSRQAAIFRAQMASGREESRLEVRYDMLLAIGDTLQRAHRQGRSAEERLPDVIVTLNTALRAGGAEELGASGDTVRYDPKVHHSRTEVTRGAMVTLVAPGVVVRDEALGDRVILKARVAQQSEVT